jgi:NAD(P)-dependent dehydrogenase (short-subunit alcohol dehydrogenase family)
MRDPGRRLGEMMDLTGRVALVTGGAGHIGFQSAAALAELGAKVVLADVRDAEDAAAELPDALGIPCDLGKEDEVRALPERAVARFGRLDIVVAAAGFVGTSGLKGWVTPFEEQTAETWRQAMEVNLTSFFVLVQAALPHLREHGCGSVIAISSIYGIVGPDLRLYEGTAMGNPAAYAASKGGLLQMARWLATVLAPEVRVNAVTPGGIARGQPEAFVRRYEERTPLRRLGREEELKGAVAYLAGDAASYVTGQNIVVDGGWTAW